MVAGSGQIDPNGYNPNVQGQPVAIPGDNSTLPTPQATAATASAPTAPTVDPLSLEPQIAKLNALKQQEQARVNASQGVAKSLNNASNTLTAPARIAGGQLAQVAQAPLNLGIDAYNYATAGNVPHATFADDIAAPSKPMDLTSKAALQRIQEYDRQIAELRKQQQANGPKNLKEYAALQEKGYTAPYALPSPIKGGQPAVTQTNIPTFAAQLADKHGVSSNLVAAFMGQESNGGKADTSKPNAQNVIGPMQVQLDTFNGLKKQGLIPADYDFKNPEHTTEAGIVLLKQLSQQYGGDISKIAAAYYGGPGAVNADGSINTDWKNKTRPNDPTVGQYVQQILARVGGTQNTQTAAASTTPAAQPAAQPAATQTAQTPATGAVQAPLATSTTGQTVKPGVNAQYATGPNSDPLMTSLQERMTQVANIANHSYNPQERLQAHLQYSDLKLQAYDRNLLRATQVAGSGDPQAMGNVLSIYSQFLGGQPLTLARGQDNQIHVVTKDGTSLVSGKDPADLSSKIYGEASTAMRQARMELMMEYQKAYNQAAGKEMGERPTVELRGQIAQVLSNQNHVNEMEKIGLEHSFNTVQFDPTNGGFVMFNPADPSHVAMIKPGQMDKNNMLQPEMQTLNAAQQQALLQNRSYAMTPGWEHQMAAGAGMVNGAMIAGVNPQNYQRNPVLFGQR
jgi:hypothetical protein